MKQNYFQGAEPPQINAFLAAAGWNLKKMMQKLKENAKSFVLRLLSFVCGTKNKLAF